MKNEILIKENHAELIIKSKKYGDKIVLIDKEDVKKIKIFNYSWHLNYRDSINNFYIEASTTKNNKKITYRLHRVITDCPKGLVVDHINHNPLDNRKCNLKVCFTEENNKNRKEIQKNNKSGYKNINKHKNKWQVRITRNKKVFNIGEFKTLEQAIQERDKFLCLN